MKILHYPQKCIGCGACISLCPEIWQMKDDGKSHLIRGEKKSEYEELTLTEENPEVQTAAESCPVKAIELRNHNS